MAATCAARGGAAAARKGAGASRVAQRRAAAGVARVGGFFKQFRQDSASAGIEGAQGRDDFDYGTRPPPPAHRAGAARARPPLLIGPPPHPQRPPRRTAPAADDIEQYFNYMGILAIEGSYDSMEAMIASGLPSIDVLLIMAVKEGDVPKVEELLKAGADTSVEWEGKSVQEWAGANNEAKRPDVLALLG